MYSTKKTQPYSITQVSVKKGEIKFAIPANPPRLAANVIYLSIRQISSPKKVIIGLYGLHEPLPAVGRSNPINPINPMMIFFLLIRIA